MGVVAVVDGDELGAGLMAGLVVVVVSVVDGDCAVRLEHAANPLLKKMAAIANPAHIFGGTAAGFTIVLRLTNARSWLLRSVIIF